MSSDAKLDRQRALSEESTRWLVMLQSGELSAEQRAEFVDWLRASPTHISELLRMGELDAALSQLPLWKSLAPMTGQRSNVVSLGDRGRGEGSGATRSTPWRRWAVAAGLVAVVAACYLALSTHGDLRLRTMPGEHRELALEDGSVVDLAPDTDLTVRYETHRRGIALAHGQAMFRVAKNPQRPFIVEAAGTQVRAVGTVFNVERGEQGILVSVVEGHVAVTQQRRLGAALQSRPSPAVVNLNPNEELRIDASGEPSAVRRLQYSPPGNQPGDTLSFENETVADVAQKFNARNRLHIEVRTPAVGTRRISGVFYANDPESFIAFVEAVTDADVRRETPDRVLILSR